MYDFNFMVDNKKESDTGLDPVEALMDVQVAEEGLLVASANYDMLVTACENIEAGVALGEAIAAKGDEASAVVVARESLRQNLKVLGQEHVVGMVVTAGTESITAANEGISDMLGKAWAKVKEITMKIWNWISELFSKGVQFFKSLVGKGDTTYERLVKLVKKHKDAKTTNLDGQEFSESVKKSINSKFGMLASKGEVSGSGIITYLKAASENFTTEYEKRDTLVSETIKNYVLTQDKVLKEFNTSESGVDFLGNSWRTSPKETIAHFTTTLFKGGLGNKKVNGELPKGVTESDVISELEDKTQDVHTAYVNVVGNDFNKVYFTALVLTEDGYEAHESITKNPNKDDAKAETILGKEQKVIKGIKVVSFTMQPEPSEYEDNADKISPLEFPEVEDIMKEMKDVDKIVSKVMSKQDSKISKEKRELEKTLKDAYDKAKSDGKKSPVIERIKTILSNCIRIKTDLAKSEANATMATAKALSVSPVYDYCAESAKLYKKD